MTSGLSSVGYSVVWSGPTSTPQQLDCDLIAGSRMRGSDIFKRCRAHSLVLTTVIERNPPAALALGPAVEPDEPEEFIAGMRVLVHQLAYWLRVPVIDFASEDQLIKTLNVGSATKRPRRLNGLVVHHLGKPLQSTDRRVVMATATALAAVMVNAQRFASSAPPSA